MTLVTMPVQARWFGASTATPTDTAGSSMAPHLLTVLRGLPIWRRPCASGTEAPTEEAFGDLIDQRYLAPRSVPDAALPPTFVLALDDGQAGLLVKVSREDILAGYLRVC